MSRKKIAKLHSDVQANYRTPMLLSCNWITLLDQTMASPVDIRMQPPTYNGI